jgi:hypothetical protein
MITTEEYVQRAIVRIERRSRRVGIWCVSCAAASAVVSYALGGSALVIVAVEWLTALVAYRAWRWKVGRK